MKPSQFTLLQKGNKSQLFLYQHTLVLKMVDSRCRQELLHLRNEFQIMKTICHPNILRVVRLRQSVPIKDCRRDILVMEYANKGSLLKALKEGMEVGVKRGIARELVGAFRYLHGVEQVAHRDVKLDNILVREEEGGRVTALVSDFGFALKRQNGIESEAEGSNDRTQKGPESSTNELNPQKTSTSNEAPPPTQQPFVANSCKGTKRAYMAPELHKLTKGSHYDPFKVDIFSFGVVLHGLFFEKLPFELSIESKDLMFKLVSEKRFAQFWAKLEINEAKYPDLPLEELKQLLEGMFNPDPKERMSIEEVFSSPFMEYLNSTVLSPEAKQSTERKAQREVMRSQQFTAN